MTVSTDAHFAYGFVIDEESDDHERIGDYLGSGDDEVDADPLEQLEEENKVTIINTCSDSSPLYVLAVLTTHTVANRGYPKHIDMSKIAKTDLRAADKLLRNAAKKLGVTYKPAAWLLGSYWEV